MEKANFLVRGQVHDAVLKILQQADAEAEIHKILAELEPQIRRPGIDLAKIQRLASRLGKTVEIVNKELKKLIETAVQDQDMKTLLLIVESMKGELRVASQSNDDEDHKLEK